MGIKFRVFKLREDFYSRVFNFNNFFTMIVKNVIIWAPATQVIFDRLKKKTKTKK